jgi:pimeloyl-ACP methyl ester carboxylesterase
MTVEGFRIHVPDAVLADLRGRIRATRWPDQVPGLGWDQGTELTYLRRLLAYWADGFDWRAREEELNAYAHRMVRVEDGDGATVNVHVVHEKAHDGHGIPLILTHGWPSSWLEYLSLVPLLTEPAAGGGPTFDLVIASLPGYGFSPRPPRTGVNYRYTAGLWHRVMRELGYERYGAHGGDFGAGVASYLALDRPHAVLGLHLSTMELVPVLGPDAPPLTAAETAYLADNDDWSRREHAYSDIQATKPQTVGYGLSDSPAGLAAWLLEKWRAWTDSGGDPQARFSADFLLSLLTLTWATNSITSSMRDYWDNRWSGAPLTPADRVRVPTAFAAFDHHFVPEGHVPREWVARLYDLRRFTVMPRGGHFAAAEEPRLLADDLRAFFGDLPPRSE